MQSRILLREYAGEREKAPSPAPHPQDQHQHQNQHQQQNQGRLHRGLDTPKETPRFGKSTPPFRTKLRGNPIRVLTLQDVLANHYSKIETSVAPSQVGRLLQIIKACGWKP